MDGAGIKQVETLVGNATAKARKRHGNAADRGRPVLQGDVLQTLAEASIDIVLAKKIVAWPGLPFASDEFVYVSGSKRGRWTRISS